MWIIVFFLVAGYLVIRSGYRLYFHPLCQVPGPKLAAITRSYEFYHDVVRNGMYIWEVEKMHQRYGPAVRISPSEIHIKDPHYYDQVYASSSKKREKDPRSVGIFAFSTSMIATVGHDLHRFRRNLLNNLFSKKAVLELSPTINEKIQKLMQRLEQAYETNRILQLDDAFAALTSDLISQYSWGASSNFLDDKNFNNEIRHALNEITMFAHVNRFFPSLGRMVLALPRWLLGMLRPGAAAVFRMQDMVAQQSSTQNDDAQPSQRTVFDVLNDPTVPDKERSRRRLEDEGLIVVVAGTETTARTLTLAAFHLYQNKQILLKLRSELQQVMPTPDSRASWLQLEQLPYLTAFINEALRFTGPIFRSTRVAPAESLVYGDLVIPPGTPVGMSGYFVLMDPDIFPEPLTFDPERWIRADKRGENLQKFLVSFSRGSRICLGMNLAYAELYLTIASLVHRFDMELYETTAENISTGRDRGIAQPLKGEFSVRAKVVKVVK